MSAYPFLSPEWITAAEALRDEYADQVPSTSVSIKLNVVVTELPANVVQPGLDTIDEKPVIKGHVDSGDGQLLMSLGHLDSPDVTITTDYETARVAFVTQDQQQLMNAFISGKILVDGDPAKLLALQAPPSDPAVAAQATEVYKKVRAFTKL